MTSENEGYQSPYPRDLFIQALNDKEGEATTADITSKVGCSRETTRVKMHELEDDDIVKSRKIGSTLVWQLV
jgi:predicted ArsR family transcriptional regulator